MTDPVAYVTDEGIPVTMPSGGVFPVLTTEEASYLAERVQRYMADNHFVNVSDLQDVDRMLVMEVLCFRWGNWLSRQRDYYGEPVDENSLRRSLNDYSSELRQLKKILGIDKAARDRLKGDDSVPVYLQNLLTRAKEFGISRNNQSAKAVELVMQLQSLMTLHKNCDAVERTEQHVTQDEIFEWISDVLIPEFNVIDAAFRAGQQKTWIRSM